MSKPERTPIAGTPGVVRRIDAAPRSFDPWKFGTVPIPKGLRKELLGTELPVIPQERLYVSRGPAALDVSSVRDVERRGSLLAAGAVVLLFGTVLLGWAVLGDASASARDAAPRSEGSP